MIAVYDFALGPERPKVDPLENEREAAAFIREEGGVLTPTEVLALSGGSYEVAEERMADYMARFGGEPRITDEGVVVGEFQDFLTRSSEQHPDGEIVPFWEEYEAPLEGDRQLDRTEPGDCLHGAGHDDCRTDPRTW